MDATNKQKILTGVFVTLLVGSVFVGAVPASAQPNPSGSGTPVAVVDALSTTTASFAGVSWTVNTVTIPTDGLLRYNGTYDLTFTNITQTATTGGYGYGQTTTGYVLVQPTGFVMPNARPSANDDAHAAKLNVTFPLAQLNATGVWKLRDGLGNTVAWFFVLPKNDLTFTMSQTSFTYSRSAVGFTMTVAPFEVGQTIALSDEGGTIPSGTTITGSGGQYGFFGAIAQAGSYNVNATRDEATAVSGTGIAGSGTSSNLPEHIGTVLYTVNPATLVVVANDTTLAKSGFDSIASWNITYPTNNTPVFVSPMNLVNYNFTITGPGNYGRLWVNGSTTTGYTVWFERPSDGLLFSDSTADANHQYNFTPEGPTVTWWYDMNTVSGFAGHNFTFAPNSTWPAGSFAFSLVENQAGANPSANEYTAAWSFAAAAPASLNVDLLINNATATNVSVIGVGCNPSNTVLTSDPPCAPAGNPLVGPPGYYWLGVRITGSTQTSHPNLANLSWNGVNVNENITVTGDVMVLGNASGFTAPSYDAGTGIVTFPGIVPLKAPGTINVHVSWPGISETKTVSIPIVEGSVLTATPKELVVDTTTSVKFHLEDRFGNPVPDGKIFLFKKISGGAGTELVGANAVNGTGAPGAGQNGDYTISLTPNTVGKYIAYAITGRVEGSTDHRRYAYAELSVVPAHDVAVTLSSNSTMASVTTYLFVNATTPNGVSVPTVSSLYFLTDQELKDVRANGSSNLPATSITGGTVALGTINAAGWNLNVTAPPGVFNVYVCSTALCVNAKHDNNQSLPLFTVNKFHAVFAPAKIANNANIQSNVTVNVTITDVSGNPWNGSLELVAPTTALPGAYGCVTSVNNTCTPGSAVTSQTVTVTNGVGTFVATGLTVGDVWYKFNPTGSTDTPTSSLVDTAFQVVGPNVVVTPDRIPIGKASTITVSVKSLAGDALPNLSIRMCGTPIGGNDTNPACTGTVLTDAGGSALVGVNPISTGTLGLFVNNITANKTVLVYAGLVISYTPSTPVANDTVTLTVNQVGQTAGESGVSVAITKNGTAVSGFPQTTNSNGQVVLANVQEGTYLVTGSKAGFQDATVTLVVGAGTTTPPAKAAKFELDNLVAPTSANVGQALTVSADVNNVGDADGTATLLLLVNGAVRGSQSIPIAAGGSETIAYEFTPTQAGTFKVTVKLATGETLAEKTVTVSTPTTTTTGTTTTTTTTTTPTGTTEPTPEVPGFEVVALIGALAVALLVLRRKN